MSFQDRLREALLDINIQRHGAGSWLSNQTGVTVKAANKWLNGESQPYRENIEILAKLTGVRIEWLEYGIGGKKVPLSVEEKKASYQVNTARLDAHAASRPLAEGEVDVPFYNEKEILAKSSPKRKGKARKLRFSQYTLDKADVLIKNVACCNVTGDSMSPVLPNDTTVAIDISQTAIEDGKIYAIEHGGLFRIKYLYLLPYNGLKVRSANPTMEDEDLDQNEAEKVRIIGRVFWYAVFL